MIVRCAWCRPTFVSIAALSGWLTVNCALGQGFLGAMQANRGVRHQVSIAIKSDPKFSPQQDSNDERRATVTVKLRISAHSLESDFSGVVPVTISDFDPVKGSAEQQVWEDARCHHERGIPKISAVAIEGSLNDGHGDAGISAEVRHIGQKLPADELGAGKSLPSGRDSIGPFRAIGAETLRSHLMLNMKLHILPCELAAARDNPPGQPKAGSKR